MERAMSFEATKDVVLFVLAIYGAALSTWNLIKASRKDRRSIRVKAGSKIPVQMGGHLAKRWAHIEVTNAGHRPVTIKTIAFELTDGRRLVSLQRHNPPGLDDTQLPVSLSDGQSASFHLSYFDIGHALTN